MHTRDQWSGGGPDQSEAHAIRLRNTAYLETFQPSVEAAAVVALRLRAAVGLLVRTWPTGCTCLSYLSSSHLLSSSGSLWPPRHRGTLPLLQQRFTAADTSACLWGA